MRTKNFIKNSSMLLIFTLLIFIININIVSAHYFEDDTLYCYNLNVGDSFNFNGETFYVVDDNDIKTRIQNNQNVCTSHVTDLSTGQYDSYFGDLNPTYTRDFNLTHWDVSSVTSINSLFRNDEYFNQDIGHWDVSSVTSMEWVFQGSVNKFNHSLNDWDVSNVESMAGMFYINTVFNHPLYKWDTSKVTDMSMMFAGLSTSRVVFNQDIRTWNVTLIPTEPEPTFSAHSDLSSHYEPLWGTEGISLPEPSFENGTLYCDEYDIGDSFEFNGETFYVVDDNDIQTKINNNEAVCTTFVTNLDEIFLDYNGDYFDNYNISKWDVSSVTSMFNLFGWSNFNQNISNWDTSSVTNMREMFRNSDFNQPLNDWDVSSVTNMRSMFHLNPTFNQPLNNWNTSNVINMQEMFSNSNFNQPINDWDTSSVTNMNRMFLNSDFNQPLNDWDVSSVTNMDRMFSNSDFNQPINDWDVSSVTNMNMMFRNANDFNQNISNWNFENINSDFGFSLSFAFITNQNYDYYDDLLISLNNQELNNNIDLYVNTYYTLRSAEERQNIINNFNWDIIDLGIKYEDFEIEILKDYETLRFDDNITFDLNILDGFVPDSDLKLNITKNNNVIDEITIYENILLTNKSFNFGVDFKNYNFLKNDEISFIVYIEYEEEKEIVSNIVQESVIIENYKPFINTFNFQSNRVNHNTNLFLFLNTDDKDINDDLSYDLKLFNNNVLILETNETNINKNTTLNILDYHYNNTSVGDTFKAVINVTDGDDYVIQETSIRISTNYFLFPSQEEAKNNDLFIISLMIIISILVSFIGNKINNISLYYFGLIGIFIIGLLLLLNSWNLILSILLTLTPLIFVYQTKK